MHTLLQGGFYYWRKMVALCAITVVILALIAIFLDGAIEKIFDFFDLIFNPREIHEPEWRSMLLNKMLERKPIECEIAILDIKAFLREIIRLIDQVEIRILHC